MQVGFVDEIAWENFFLKNSLLRRGGGKEDISG